MQRGLMEERRRRRHSIGTVLAMTLQPVKLLHSLHFRRDGCINVYDKQRACVASFSVVTSETRVEIFKPS